MKKYTFLVYHRDYPVFLEKIQELGMVHVIEKESGTLEDENLRNIFSQAQHLKKIIDLLKSRKIEPVESKNNKSAILLMEEIDSLVANKENYIQQLANLNKELSVLSPWGKFDWDTVENLKKAGIITRFFIGSSRQFLKAEEEGYNVEKINQVKGGVYFVLFDAGGIESRIDAEEIKLPHTSVSQVEEQINKIESKIKETEQKLDELAKNSIPVLETYLDELNEQFSFKKVILNTTREAEEKLMVLEGWVPKDNIENLENYLSTADVYYETSMPAREEKVPIKLKNNKFSRLFEVIGELYTSPTYNELDLTPYFAPFYWMFFGFCLGDAGYGLIITLAGLILTFKGSRNMRNTFKLATLLGISTIIFGLLSGTFFGISLYEMKFWFYADLAKKFDEQNKTINDYLFRLSLLLGGIQIIYGMAIKVANVTKMYGWKYSFGPLGWLIIIVGLITWFILGKAGVPKNISDIVLIGVLVVGGSGAFLFNNPERNVFINFGSGLWNTYNMVTGILGDLLSYIRLFALGISSGILGYVFNSLALQFAPENWIGKIIVMVLILGFGHGINIFMAALGSFVHPVRLTFVEFYKNAGFVGGGIKYNPFSKKIIK